ncbi:MAG: 50S ribosomal protein L1 [Candidatus Aenigmarchaeota archaeon]|nr:50S ribosomal protein L1 [Candidatus Aenigmarchaeota archaeon]
MAEEILTKIKEAREKAKKRKFSQTFDLVVSLAGIDLKKPENRLNLDFLLPEGRGKSIKVALIADSLTAAAKDVVDLLIRKEEIDALSKDVKKLKTLAREYDSFFGEISLMPLIGKTLGQVLGPLGKMPKPVPPNANIKAFTDVARKTIKIRVTTTPVIHTIVGSEDMDDKKIEANANALVNFVKEKLPKGRNNIKAVYIKLTMGPAIKLPLKL